MNLSPVDFDGSMDIFFLIKKLHRSHKGALTLELNRLDRDSFSRWGSRRGTLRRRSAAAGKTESSEAPDDVAEQDGSVADEDCNTDRGDSLGID